jgi:hypothetical protein
VFPKTPGSPPVPPLSPPLNPSIPAWLLLFVVAEMAGPDLKLLASMPWRHSERHLRHAPAAARCGGIIQDRVERSVARVATNNRERGFDGEVRSEYGDHEWSAKVGDYRFRRRRLRCHQARLRKYDASATVSSLA